MKPFKNDKTVDFNSPVEYTKPLAPVLRAAELVQASRYAAAVITEAKTKPLNFQKVGAEIRELKQYTERLLREPGFLEEVKENRNDYSFNRLIMFIYELVKNETDQGHLQELTRQVKYANDEVTKYNLLEALEELLA